MAELFKRLSQTSPRVNIVRIFEDGDYVFAYTDYNFNVLEIGFEVFRFEDGLAVEHWDNLQHKHSSPNPSGHTMTDGPTEVTDLDKTEVNRKLVRSFVEEVLINGQLDRLEHYIDAEGYTEHNPHMYDTNPSPLLSSFQRLKYHGANECFDTQLDSFKSSAGQDSPKTLS